MGIFISVPKTVECAVTAIVLACLLCVAVYKQAGVLQSSGYSNKKYFDWVKRQGNLAFQRFVFLAMMCALSSAAIGLAFSFAGEWAAVVSLAAYLVFFVLYFFADKKVALRSEVTPTPRFKRLYAIAFLVFAIISYLLITLLNFADYVWGNKVFSYLRYVPLAVMPLSAIPLLMLANGIAKIYEVPHNKKFIRQAKKKLAQSNVKVIAITGSYGKTTTKNILFDLLSEKYRVLTTPRSHNTPIGIALAVNNANLEDYDIFIAEMGARHIGDIAELCEICPPDYSLITGICGQHLETFLTFKNIVNAKAEILSATKNVTVIADDAFDLFADFNYNKSRCACATDIVSGKDGTEFTLTLGGESKRVKTKLLGEHSANNIALAAEAAFAVGMTLDEIASAIGGIDYIEHRLQLIESGGVNILDDGYNSNVKGARAALKVLKYFDGRKIVVTPGLVELGVLEEDENSALGKELVGFDLVILVGDTLVKFVEKGYKASGGDMEKIVVMPTLASAQEELKGYLHSGDTVLFLNDLPDIY
ncbi:MAG: UDP-N-acetylmuramoyl-tripeptide--D-alanyl-D-alanine ligase [Clostridia bacterium]|nr:UDP-N-acetylmuramoyl-tripeptide--D-alanyl-D-alanine ligase [Clostridia bacterium]